MVGSTLTRRVRVNKDKQHEPSAQRANGIDLTEYGPEELGRCIRDARTSLGYSQRQLARLVGRVPSNIHVIESGKYRPTTQTFESLINVLSSAFVDQRNLLEKTLQKFDYIANPDREIIDLTLYDPSRLGDLVRDARIHLKLTQDQLANGSEVSRDTVRRIESGESGVQRKTLAGVFIQLRSAFSPQIDVPRDMLLHFGHYYLGSGAYLDLRDYNSGRLDELIRDTCHYLGHSQYGLSSDETFHSGSKYISAKDYISGIFSNSQPPAAAVARLRNLLARLTPAPRGNVSNTGRTLPRSSGPRQ